MRKRLSGSALLLVGGIISILAVSFFGWSLWRIQNEASDLRTSELKLEELTQELLQSIGYTGLIHDFKNCVLRPNELFYCDRAEEDARTALALINEIGTLSRENELEIDLVSMQEAVRAYGRQVSIVKQSHARGVPVEEIDAQVRVDDLPAARELAVSIPKARETLFGSVETLAWTYFALSVVGIALLLVLTVLFILLSRYEGRFIRQKQERLDAVFSAISGGVIGLDGQGGIRLINPTARRLLNIPARRPPMPWPAHLRFRVPGQMDDTASVDLRFRALNDDHMAAELFNIEQEGSAVPAQYVRVSSAALTEASSGLAAVIFVDDVTVEERNRQQIERNSRLDALGQLSGGIAHDFNNVLATILYSVNLTMKEPQTEKAKRLLRRALSTIERARQLTERLLAFGRRAPGKAHSRAISAVFRDFEALARTAIEADVEVCFVEEEEGLYVHCDQAQLENALLNLVLNGRDAIRDAQKGGRITVAARPVQKEVPAGPSDAEGETIVRRFIEISVTDDGPGMNEEIRARSTDPFFSMKPTGRGTGLGLAMVYGFVQQSEGEFRIYSAPDHGTTVRMTLPRGTERDQREGTMSQEPPARAGGETILLVEDEADLLEMMKEVLVDLGYRVETAGTGQEAWARVEQGLEFDVLLSDVVMPGGLTGFDLAEKVRARMPGRPVILMSGYAGLSHAQAEAGTVTVLQKPCMPAELARALRDALDGA